MGLPGPRSPLAMSVLPAIANLALFSAWIVLHGQPLRWLAARFSGAPLHAGILLGAALLMGVRLGASGSFQRVLAAVSRSPHASPLPLAVTASSAVALVVAEHRLGPSTLSALLLGLGAYGLFGLYAGARAFVRALPSGLLLVALLPFGEQADTYFGFTARVWTAHIVSRVLALLGHAAVPVETILVLENGVAHVEAACSGARGLWTGVLFFLAATVVLGRRPGARWVLTGLVHVALLLFENVVRIAAVVILAVGLGLPRVSEILHVPLGVLGFALTCGLTLGALHYFVPALTASPPRTPSHEKPSGFHPAWILAVLFLGLTLVPRHPVTGAPRAPEQLDLSFMAEVESLPLTETEADLFRRWGGSADKRSFRGSAGTGTLLAVFSRSWRAHHAPEICLASSGIHLEGLHEIRLEEGATVRVASVDGGRRTAVYWYQSPVTTTADLSTRIFRDISGQERRWVQLSMIVDSPFSPETTEGRALIHSIRAAIARVLAKESS